MVLVKVLNAFFTRACLGDLENPFVVSRIIQVVLSIHI